MEFSKEYKEKKQQVLNELYGWNDAERAKSAPVSVLQSK